MSGELWKTLTWGLSTIVTSIKGYNVTYDNHLAQREEAQSQEEKDGLDEKFKNYYHPFLSYVKNYMFTAIERVEIQFGHLTDAYTRESLSRFYNDLTMILG